MEIERHRPAELRSNECPESTVLPPPPAPFPTELIGASQSARHHDVQTPISRQAQIGSLQRSVVDVLTDLLASSPTLDEPSGLNYRDQRLATALTELLEVTYDLDSSDGSHVRHEPTDISLEDSFEALEWCLADMQTATRGECDRTHSLSDRGASLHPAIYAVREELAWARLDSLSTAILAIVRDRRSFSDVDDQMDGDVNRQNAAEEASLPPRYSFDGTSDGRTEKADLPDYSDGPAERTALAETGSTSILREKEAAGPLRRSVSAPREKMLLELDGLTEAIDRLHSAIPRLNDQRVEMRASSSRTSFISPSVRARAERDKQRELEIIWDQIERTHGKSLSREGQRVDASGWEDRRAKQKERYMRSLFENGDAHRLENQDSKMGKVDAELARARDLRDRDLFLRELVEQSADSRLSDQDAPLTPSTAQAVEERRFLSGVLDRSRSGHLDGQDYPLTLDERLEQRRGEFVDYVVERTTNGRLQNQDSAPSTPRIRSDSSRASCAGNPEELVTMQDFFKEKRQRSNSTPIEGEKRINGFDKIKGIIRRGSAGLGLKINNELEVSNLYYIAEHQQNLNVVQIMVHGIGISASSEVVIETDIEASEQATLISKSSSTTHASVTLPVAAVAGQSVPLLLQNFHLEGRLACLPTTSSAPMPSLNTVITQALSASDLRRLEPKSLCCATCDREVAELPVKGTYKDLPSEHWAEMLEIWMCHSDPSFTANISAKAQDGFWPGHDSVLVGGSYLLLEGAYAKRHNLVVGDEAVAGWRSVQCGCGEVLGKQRDSDGERGAGTVRFAKWSIALLKEDDYDADSVQPIRYPISVFIVSDLLELAQAHASYRFVISEEETGQTRLVVWLFNPSTRISYRQAPALPQPSPLRTPKTVKRRSFTSSKSRRSSINSLASAAQASPAEVKSIRASKIMYKVAQEGQAYETLPGFGPAGQVERISYPRDACERLVIALSESTALYPVGRRTMGEFNVGFLERV